MEKRPITDNLTTGGRAGKEEEMDKEEIIIFTYKNQPTDNVDAWRLGDACNKAVSEPAGDLIDRGLSLLKELEVKGYGIIKL